VSSGKSSLLNALYGAKVKEVGQGKTTTEVALAFTIENMMFYDLPGNDIEFDYMDLGNLAFFKYTDLVLLVFENDLVDTGINDLMRVLDAINANVAFVRNKCDLYDPEEDCKPFEYYKERDMNEIRKIFGNKPVKYFTVSSKNAYKKEGDQFDFHTLKQIIVNIKQ